jgi:flagellar basal-body rod modification protein FlgD
MSQIPSTGGTGTTGTSSTGKSQGNDLRDVDIDQFMNLLIAQLQNQDPLSPMDNSEMLQQISQIREISATNKLSDTLDSVLLGQNLSTASSLIGREVKALTDDAQDVSGLVDRVSIETSGTNGSVRTLRVHIGDSKIDLRNIREILPP